MAGIRARTVDGAGARAPLAALAAVAGALLLTACSGPAAPAATVPPTTTPPAVPATSQAASQPPATVDTEAAAARARCEDLLAVTTVRGLLGGTPEVEGGRQRVTGSVTQTRCLWVAPNGLYLSVVSLDGPGLPARARTVTAGAEPVVGRPGVLYDARRGLIVTVDERLHQVVAGGAGTAQARVVGLKAIEAIRAGA